LAELTVILLVANLAGAFEPPRPVSIASNWLELTLIKAISYTVPGYKMRLLLVASVDSELPANKPMPAGQKLIYPF